MGQLMHAIAKSNLLQTIYSRHILGAFPTQRHFLLSYTISVWIMERNKSISTSKKEKKKKEQTGSCYYPFLFHSMFQQGRNMWGSGSECVVGVGREQPCCREERPYDAAVFSAANNGRLVCPRKSLWLPRRHPRVERIYRKWFRFPHYFGLATTDVDTPNYWLRNTTS